MVSVPYLEVNLYVKLRGKIKQRRQYHFRFTHMETSNSVFAKKNYKMRDGIT